MTALDPVCALCFGPMRIVEVHHKNQPTSRWPFCPGCVTTRHLDQTDQPIPAADLRPARHLRAVP